MTEAPSTMSRYDLEAKIVKRCWENEAFRKEFVSDPKAAFVNYLRVPAANVPEVVVHEEPQGAWHIVIPARPNNAEEMSEAELEKVAGGATTLVALVSVGVSLVASGLGTEHAGW